MHADDYDYSFSFAGAGRIHSLKDVYYSQVAHYFKQNGRISTLGLAQILLMLNQTVIDIVLSLFFVALGVLIAFHIEGDIKNISWIKLFYIYFLLLVVTPAFGQSYLWTNSASIYLAGVVMILIYCVPYRKVLYDHMNGGVTEKPLAQNIFLFLWMLLMGFLAGNSNENMSVGLITIVIAYLTIFLIFKVKLHAWMYGIGNIGGFLALILSPGNQRRLDSAGGINFLAIPKRFILVAALFFDNMGYFVIALVVIIAVIYLYFRKPRESILAFFKSLSPLGFVYFFGMLGSVFSMIVLPFFPSKAWSLAVALSIITLFSFGKEIERRMVQKNYKIILITTIAAMAVFLGVYSDAYFTIKSDNAWNNVRLSLIQEALENGDKSVKIPAIVDYNKWTPYEGSGELSWDSSAWPNKAIARYYGLDEVIREDNPNSY